MDDKQPSEPTITLPLRSFLQVLWGYKYTAVFGDRRERAYPGEEIVRILEEQVPPEVAKQYFKVVRAQPSVDVVVWEVNEWHTSGAAEQEARAKADNFQYASDKITDYLMANVPLCQTLGRVPVRHLALQVVQQANWAVLQLPPFSLSDSMIEDLKTGRYGNNI